MLPKLHNAVVKKEILVHLNGIWQSPYGQFFLRQEGRLFWLGKKIRVEIWYLLYRKVFKRLYTLNGTTRFYCQIIYEQKKTFFSVDPRFLWPSCTLLQCAINSIYCRRLEEVCRRGRALGGRRRGGLAGGLSVIACRHSKEPRSI